jgi:hypothetical protein
LYFSHESNDEAIESIVFPDLSSAPVKVECPDVEEATESFEDRFMPVESFKDDKFDRSVCLK